MSKVDELRKRHEELLEAERKKEEQRIKREEDHRQALTKATAAVIGLKGLLVALLQELKGNGAQVEAGDPLLHLLGLDAYASMGVPMGTAIPLLGCVYRRRAVGFYVATTRAGTVHVASEIYEQHAEYLWAPRRANNPQPLKASPASARPPLDPAAITTTAMLLEGFYDEFEWLLGLPPSARPEPVVQRGTRRR